jgi:hypothetical protein
MEEAVGQAVQAGFGLLALAAQVLTRGAGGGLSPAASNSHPQQRTAHTASDVGDALDMAIGAAWGLTRIGVRASFVAVQVARPAVSLVLAPPLVPTTLQPATLLARNADRWRRDRPAAIRALATWTSSIAPDVLELGLSLIDLDALVAIVLDVIDVDAAVRHALDEVDLEARIEQVLASIDVSEPVQLAMAQLDLADLVEHVMSEIDLTALVLEHLDLRHVVDAALDSLDLNAVVRERVDLPSLAEYVVEEIDLPELVRESTGSLASEGVRGVRMQGIDADQALSRVIDRLLRRSVSGRATLADSEDGAR